MRSTSTTHGTTSNFHLTRKGQFLLGGVSIILIGLGLIVAWLQPPMPPAVAAEYHYAAGYQEIMVQPGDTLWAISSRVAQGEKQSAVLEQISAYNDLETSELQVGQTLYVPLSHP